MVQAAAVAVSTELGPCCAGVLARQASAASSQLLREELASLNAAGCFRGMGAHMRGLQTSAAPLEAFNVNVPPMGESITEGTIANVLKKEGDPVKEDDVIAQIETDKVRRRVQGGGPGLRAQALAGQGQGAQAQTCAVGPPVPP
ncbi:Dihydrolipoyllysine-residue succinyltransferase [Tetrabaena socialis]|uniref:Dihydrolipoyllysine-residue succinyltransferase n=1 Tax=Tetrabaena socialis TaxID=47790 RepID=A0A2J7ZLN0_9CHLO|nr:Dihydrolipoyllysine-residue succinyltransferase [Tetrabaena socialis]|eukprot:PNH01172.1 Dihydrolipoyllysine-residue succinyltransferase [Tetrabaena socialis]